MGQNEGYPQNKIFTYSRSQNFANVIRVLLEIRDPRTIANLLIFWGPPSGALPKFIRRWAVHFCRACFPWYHWGIGYDCLPTITLFIRFDFFFKKCVWLVVWNMFHFSIYWEFHHPNWPTHIFQRGRYTPNQKKGVFCSHPIRWSCHGRRIFFDHVPLSAMEERHHRKSCHIVRMAYGD